MNQYFKDKNITELCNDYIKKCNGHTSVENVRLYLLTMYKHNKRRGWQDVNTYGLKHQIERVTGVTHNEPYCSNFVVKSILFEMMLNGIVDLGLFISHNEPILKLENDNYLSSLILEDSKNLCFKFKENMNLNL